MALVSEVMERLRRLDRANYTHLVRQKEIRSRSGRDYPIPLFEKIVAIYLRSGEIADALIDAYSSKTGRTLVYLTLNKN